MRVTSYKKINLIFFMIFFCSAVSFAGVTKTQNCFFKTGDSILSSPAIGSDETIYIGSWDGNLYSVDRNCGGGSDKIRPMFNHYLKHAGNLARTKKPDPDIKINGSDSTITVSSAENISITISLNPGTREGQIADWWIAALTQS